MLAKVDGGRQELQTATAANLGETCLCHLQACVSLWECDLCQARSSWQEENKSAGHPRKLNPEECSSGIH